MERGLFYLMDIGQKIKEARIQRGLTQEELADRSELTKGFISQVERNLTSPSIATLTDILQCLGTDLNHFFREDEDNQVVFTKSDYFEKEDDDYGNTIEWIIPNAQKNEMEPILITLEEGGKTEEGEPYEGEMFGYVLQGRIRIVLGDKVYRAKKGDSFYYAVNCGYHLESDKGAKVLWVSSPPNF